MTASAPVAVLFFSPQFLPSVGGLQLTVHHWALALSDMGYRVSVCTATPPAGPVATPYAVIRTKNYREILQLMRQHDAILFFNMSLKALPLALLTKRPIFVSHHTLMPEKGWGYGLGRLKTWASNHLAIAQFACSGFVARQLKSCSVIYSPYNEKLMQREPNAPTGSGLLFMGRWVSDKGIMTLLEAFAILHRQSPGLQLTLCGDGPLRHAIAAWIADHHLQASIQLKPFCPQVEAARYYRSHAIVVVPSLVEPYGMVVTEALACGCRVVAASSGGLPEAGGNFAHYFDPGNTAALAQAIGEAMMAPMHAPEALAQHLTNKTISASSRQLHLLLSRYIARA